MTRTQDESGLSELEWWKATAPVLAKLIDARRFPVASRVGESVGQAFDAAGDPVHATAFGLECILDGVSALIVRRAGPD